MHAASSLGILRADWPAPAGVNACVTTREGGSSATPWQSFNLALHVGDDAGAVAYNRAVLQSALALPAPPIWLEQIHGTAVFEAVPDISAVPPVADAAYACDAGVVLAVLTADCLPVVLCNAAGSEIAVAHCGWRGLQAGILDAVLRRFRSPARELLAWLGPAIGPAAFEVGFEVRAAFEAAARDARHAAAIDAAFRARSDVAGKYFADLYALARAELAALGVARVSGGGCCTFGDAARFYSYRRDGITGRMATLIWISPPAA